MKRKIGIAMSGGVDSTAAALFLQQQFGAENLQGFFMRLSQPDFTHKLNEVTQIAQQIDIPLQVIDLREQFEEIVLTYFSKSYLRGVTPNPCILCNKMIKFGLLVEAMHRNGADYVATGHYAKISAKQPYRLFMGKDRKKDQSYFLARLQQKHLANVLFPLGDMEKEEIYNFVEQHGFLSFRGKESQDVCFLEHTTLALFLNQRQEVKAPGGRIVDTSGVERGRHKGLHTYTIGQRKGLGISHPTPLYVVALNAATNEVVVGEEEELFCQSLTLHKIHWLQEDTPDDTENLIVKIRYGHKGTPARLIYDDTVGQLFFTKPLRAVTPGQFAVFYQNDELLGSGVIQ